MPEKRHTGGMFNMDAEGNVMFRLWAKTSSLRDRLRHEPKQRRKRPTAVRWTPMSRTR